MFDLLRSIAAGFGGKLKESPEARKLVWVLIVALFFSGCCIFFIAYVSYSRYLAIAGFLPGAEVVAMFFTIDIAISRACPGKQLWTMKPMAIGIALAMIEMEISSL